jgi:hypothetical protein
MKTKGNFRFSAAHSNLTMLQTNTNAAQAVQSITLAQQLKCSSAAPPNHNNTNCMNDGTLSIPTLFNYLPFDELMGNHKIFEVNKTLDDVTSLECIAHMGRPL